tara:strand:+ start:840 stop:1154 length:315 start_codon:yes stop_codon:yes gene_type:complete
MHLIQKIKHGINHVKKKQNENQSVIFYICIMSSTLFHWKKIFEKEKDDPSVSPKFFCIKRNTKGKLIEVIYIYRLKDHIKDDIYTFKEIIEIMTKEKEKSNVQV